MKLISGKRIRILSAALIAALFMSFAVLPAANAAVVVVDPGKTATVTLDFADACAIEGEVVFSDPSVIEGDPTYTWSAAGMKGAVENGLIFLYADNPYGASGKIEVVFTASSTAPKGSSCRR